MRETSFFVAQNPPLPENSCANDTEQGEEKRQKWERTQYRENPSDRLTEELLGCDLAGRTVVNLGISAGQALRHHCAHYGATLLSVTSGIEHTPLGDNEAHISHLKFALGRIKDNEHRRQVIHEALRVAAERSVFIEYDWTGMEGGQPVQEFKKAALEILRATGLNPYRGNELAAEVESIAEARHTVRCIRANHAAAHDPEELRALGLPLAHVARASLNRADLAQRLESALADATKAESAFTPPQLVGIELQKVRQ